MTEDEGKEISVSCPECEEEFIVTGVKEGQLEEGINTVCPLCEADVEIYDDEDEFSNQEPKIKKYVKFFGGHKLIDMPINGWLAIVDDKVVFTSLNDIYFELDFNDIENIEIIDDSYAPPGIRTRILGILGGDTDVQNLVSHKSVLRIKYNTGKRKKDLDFNFNGLVWENSVDECRRFYAKLNSLLD